MADKLAASACQLNLSDEGGCLRHTLGSVNARDPLVLVGAEREPGADDSGISDPFIIATGTQTELERLKAEFQADCRVYSHLAIVTHEEADELIG